MPHYSLDYTLKNDYERLALVERILALIITTFPLGIVSVSPTTYWMATMEPRQPMKPLYPRNAAMRLVPAKHPLILSWKRIMRANISYNHWIGPPCKPKENPLSRGHPRLRPPRRASPPFGKALMRWPAFYIFRRIPTPYYERMNIPSKTPTTSTSCGIGFRICAAINTICMRHIILPYGSISMCRLLGAKPTLRKTRPYGLRRKNCVSAYARRAYAPYPAV